MKKIKNAIVLFVAILLSMSVFAGCNGGKKTVTAQEATQKYDAAYAKTKGMTQYEVENNTEMKMKISVEAGAMTSTMMDISGNIKEKEMKKLADGKNTYYNETSTDSNYGENKTKSSEKQLIKDDVIYKIETEDEDAKVTSKKKQVIGEKYISAVINNLELFGIASIFADTTGDSPIGASEEEMLTSVKSAKSSVKSGNTNFEMVLDMKTIFDELIKNISGGQEVEIATTADQDKANKIGGKINFTVNKDGYITKVVNEIEFIYNCTMKLATETSVTMNMEIIIKSALDITKVNECGEIAGFAVDNTFVEEDAMSDLGLLEKFYENNKNNIYTMKSTLDGKTGINAKFIDNGTQMRGTYIEVEGIKGYLVNRTAYITEGDKKYSVGSIWDDYYFTELFTTKYISPAMEFMNNEGYTITFTVEGDKFTFVLEDEGNKGEYIFEKGLYISGKLTDKVTNKVHTDEKIANIIAPTDLNIATYPVKEI